MNNLTFRTEKFSSKKFSLSYALPKSLEVKAKNTAYQQDFFAWLNEQSTLLRNKNFANLDIENLVEELEAMGRSEQRELKSRMIVLVMHLLKWQFQPEKKGESWRKTIYEQRKQIALVIEDSPSLKSFLNDSDWLQTVWQYAIKDAVEETGLAKATFPTEPIWQVSDILSDEFYPENESKGK